MVAILVMWPTPLEQILSPDHNGSTQNLTFTCQAAWEQIFESINVCDLGQRSNNDLHLWYTYAFMSHLLDNYLYQLSVQRLQ